MHWLRRAIGVIFALGVAIGAGLLFLPAAALVDPSTRAASFALVRLAAAAVADTGLAGGLDEPGLAELTGFVWTAAMTVCAAPVVAVALLGEIAKVHAFLWYAGAAGVAAASAPWVLRAAFHLPGPAGDNSMELRFALVFFLTGLFSGAVYWALAGRSADGRRA
ncbi:MAG: hypothetical protein L0Y57_10640 [Beijerinckiaceae bacterium]|nr:hypothetical protein [Beijerinckiaceae bacterium]